MNLNKYIKWNEIWDNVSLEKSLEYLSKKGNNEAIEIIERFKNSNTFLLEPKCDIVINYGVFFQYIISIDICFFDINLTNKLYRFEIECEDFIIVNAFEE